MSCVGLLAELLLLSSEERESSFHDVVTSNDERFRLFKDNVVRDDALGLYIGTVVPLDAHGSESNQNAARQREIGNGANGSGGGNAEEDDSRSNCLQYGRSVLSM